MIKSRLYSFNAHEMLGLVQKRADQIPADDQSTCDREAVVKVTGVASRTLLLAISDATLSANVTSSARVHANTAACISAPEDCNRDRAGGIQAPGLLVQLFMPVGQYYGVGMPTKYRVEAWHQSC
jgi:hypothetical protein